jgi:hypothetical protein
MTRVGADDVNVADRHPSNEHIDVTRDIDKVLRHPRARRFGCSARRYLPSHKGAVSTLKHRPSRFQESPRVARSVPWSAERYTGGEIRG